MKKCWIRVNRGTVCRHTYLVLYKLLIFLRDFLSSTQFPVDCFYRSSQNKKWWMLYLFSEHLQMIALNLDSVNQCIYNRIYVFLIKQCNKYRDSRLSIKRDNWRALFNSYANMSTDFTVCISDFKFMKSKLVKTQ